MCITLKIKSIICVYLLNEGKTQINWVIIIRWKIRKYVTTNNITPKGSFSYALNSNEMTMTFMCWKSCEKYSVNRHTSNYHIK